MLDFILCHFEWAHNLESSCLCTWTPLALTAPLSHFSQLAALFDDLFSNLPFVWPVDSCKLPQMRICKCSCHSLLSNLICHFIAVIKLFLSPLNSLLNDKTRAEWIMTANTWRKRGSGLCYQPVVGPACNYVEISGPLSTNWMTYWKVSFFLFWYQRFILYNPMFYPRTFPMKFIRKCFFLIKAWHYFIPKYHFWPQWDQPAGPRPHCWGVEQRPHLGHHGGDNLDSFKECPTIWRGENMHQHMSYSLEK